MPAISCFPGSNTPSSFGARQVFDYSSKTVVTDIVKAFTGKTIAGALAVGAGSNFIFGTTLMDNEVSRVVYVDFLPRALAEGRYVASPEPLVVGKGLHSIQAGLDLQMKGVSASLNERAEICGLVKNLVRLGFGRDV